MSTQTLVKRVEALESQMSELSALPARVADLGAQLSQFQVEVRSEFSAIQRDIAEIRVELATCARQSAMDAEFAAVRAEIKQGFEIQAATIRAEIRGGDEETRRQMRVLHEDVIARIALLQEHLVARKTGSERKSKKKGSG